VGCRWWGMDLWCHAASSSWRQSKRTEVRWPIDWVVQWNLGFLRLPRKELAAGSNSSNSYCNSRNSIVWTVADLNQILKRKRIIIFRIFSLICSLNDELTRTDRLNPLRTGTLLIRRSFSSTEKKLEVT
jgi:hypothetical protein